MAKKRKESISLEKLLAKWQSIISDWRDSSGNVKVKVQTPGQIIEGNYKTMSELKKHIVSNVKKGFKVVIYLGNSTLTVTPV